MKVIIVGAGISGLYAGYQLKNAGINIQILEASKRTGGRILSQIHSDNDFVELGAELVHGSSSLLVGLLDSLQVSPVEIQGDSIYWQHNALWRDDDVNGSTHLGQLLADIDDIEEYQGVEVSLLEYFRSKAYFKEDMLELLDAFASEYGTVASRIGLRTLVEEEKLWECGDENYYIRSPMQRICNYLKRDIADHIQLNTRIVAVNYSGNGVVVTDEHGREYGCDIVLVSVPIGVLKSGDIRFSPPLPDDKNCAIRDLGVDNGMKVILRFSQQWWDSSVFALYGGARCTEYLVSQYCDVPTIAGFIMGERSEFFETMEDQQIGEILCEELGKIFSHNMARDTLLSCHVRNWGKDPLFKGVYSFATVYSNGARETLSRPVDERIYIIGEACNTNGHGASIQGAMESAQFACRNILSPRS